MSFVIEGWKAQEKEEGTRQVHEEARRSSEKWKI